MQIQWVKCQTEAWCTLSRVNLSTVRAEGVYVIWKPGSKAVRVGQGDIADRLSTHRADPLIMRHGQDLLVTWAAVDQAYRDGVERYLGEQYSPLECDRFPAAAPIAVNLPR